MTVPLWARQRDVEQFLKENLPWIRAHAVSDAAHLIREFLPALRGKKEWSPLMDYDFESIPASADRATN